MILWRLLPTSAMTRAEFAIENGSAETVGGVAFPVGGPAELRLDDVSLNAYPQGSGLNATRWHGKVGGKSDRSIVIRNADQVVGEIICERKFPPPQRWRFDWPNHSLTAARPGWLTYQPLDVWDGGRLIARSTRPGNLAQKTLLAARKDLPPELVLTVAYLGLLR